jgi:hypothetical protein
MTDRPPDLPPEGSAGWLDRQGRFWPCPEWRHRESAEEIIRQLGYEPGNLSVTDYLALRRHWVIIYIDGSTLGSGRPFNQAQVDTMFDLAQAHELMRRQLMAALERQRPMTLPELQVGTNWAPWQDG